MHVTWSINYYKEKETDSYNLPVTKEFKDSVEFCGEDIITHQVLVQRNTTQKKKKALNNVTELIGKGGLCKTRKVSGTSHQSG